MHIFKGERGHRTTGCHPASCGRRCTRSTTISAARALGSSITLNDIVSAWRRDLGYRRYSERSGQSAREQPATKCDGPDEVPTCCCRSAARSTTARSVPGWAICSNLSPTHARHWPRRRDPPNLWTLPSTASSGAAFPDRVARVLTFSKEFLIRHNRFFRVASPPILDVGLVVGNSHHESCGRGSPSVERPYVNPPLHAAAPVAPISIAVILGSPNALRVLSRPKITVATTTATNRAASVAST
jgi:hypothetical protein